MRTKPLPLLVIALLVCLSASRAAGAEELVVGVKQAPPFVLRGEDGAPRGFSVDLTREIAAGLRPPRTVRFEFAEDVRTHLADVAAGKVAMGIAATNVTAEREALVDFSNPYFRDALDIAVRRQDFSVSLWEALRDSDVPAVLFGLLLFIVATSHIVWLVERKRGGFARGYAQGVAQGIWWTVVTMSTVGYGDFVPKTSGGRTLGVFVIFSGIAMFGVAVASLTAAATAQHLVSPIQSVADLAGLRVGAVPDSVAARDLTRRGILPLSVASTEAGLKAVLDGEADAFVHDRSQLLYVLSKTRGDLVLVGRPFVQQNYAIAFPIGSPLRKQVNIVLQRLKEGDDSPYDAIYQRWFPTR